MMGTALLHNRVIRIDGGGLPEYTYTGEHALVEEEGGWKVRFLTSGILTPLKDMIVDVFCVGAGGGGGKGDAYVTGGGAGAGGGYTTTVKSVKLKKGTEYVISIGDGGSATVGVGGQTGGTGGTTSFDDIAEAKGGSGGQMMKGGNGGSGGGRGKNISYDETAGGKDGSDGGGSGPYRGTGQGTTTREFGETTGELYASGGSGHTETGQKGAANTGNGGSGCGYQSNYNSGKGGSGIAIMRNAREAA